MAYIDLHCDTLSALLFAKRAALPYSLRKNDLHIDLEKLRAADCRLQVFALFCDSAVSKNPLCDLLCQAELFHRLTERNADRVTYTPDLPSLRRANAQRRIGAILSLEDAGVCGADLTLLSLFYRLGVRIATLTWNHKNALAAPRGADEGVSARGFAFLEEAQRLGILVDVSHLSDKGTLELLSRTRAPVIASHSNARALCPHPRNLTDEMIRGIGACGGVIGINLYPPFLHPKESLANADAFCAQALYLSKIGGMECVALGTDFDGFGNSDAFPSAASLAVLPDALARHGFDDAQIEAILFGNAMRVLRTVL
jgi:membrane dipeptidase